MKRSCDRWWLAALTLAGVSAAHAQYGPHPPPWIPVPLYPPPGYWQPQPPTSAPADTAPAQTATPAAPGMEPAAAAPPSTGGPPVAHANAPTQPSETDDDTAVAVTPATPAAPGAAAGGTGNTGSSAAVAADDRLARGAAAAERGNFAEAFCHWRPLAEAGHAEAQYRLAWLYAKGLGLALNPGHALALWQAAADQGHVEAQFRTGWMHAHGEGTAKNDAQAAEWYFKAAQQGHEDAQELFLELLKHGSKEGRERATALVKAHPDILDIFKIQPRIQSSANLRAEPHPKAPLIAKLAPGTAVEILERKENWLKLRTAEGPSGWVIASKVRTDDL